MSFGSTKSADSQRGLRGNDFLRQTVKDHVDTIRAHVVASHPNAKFELLWPLDVNDPPTRRLNRHINLPTEWETKLGSGIDTFLIEGFQFARIDRNLDKVRWMAGYPFEVLSWPRADCRYLMGVFNAGIAVSVSATSSPFSRRCTLLANSAARGSCVTITIVLPKSRFSLERSVRTS